MEVLRERYLELLESAKGKTDLVKVITGMRRSGKTTLMRQFRDTLGDSDNVIYLDLDYIDEDMDWHGLKERLHNRIEFQDVVIGTRHQDLRQIHGDQTVPTIVQGIHGTLLWRQIREVRGIPALWITACDRTIQR